MKNTVNTVMIVLCLFSIASAVVSAIETHTDSTLMWANIKVALWSFNCLIWVIMARE